MSFIDDFAAAVEKYPRDSVTLSIVDVAVQTGVGPTINENEVWKFKVRINNKGHLNMTGISLYVGGENDVLIAGAPGGPWRTELNTPYTPGYTVNSHQITDTPYLYFKPTKKVGSTTSKVPLVEAHIYKWDADMNDLLQNHTIHANPPEAVYPNAVSGA